MKENKKKSQKLKVLVFGTYDLLHKGHIYHLKKASKYGELYVVVARDSTVMAMKKKVSLHNEKERLSNIRKLDFVHRAMLGNKVDKFKVILEVNPDIICLGYDQVHFTKNLKDILKKRGLNVKVIRFKKAYFPEKYKTSIIRAESKL